MCARLVVDTAPLWAGVLEPKAVKINPRPL